MKTNLTHFLLALFVLVWVVKHWKGCASGVGASGVDGADGGGGDSDGGGGAVVPGGTSRPVAALPGGAGLVAVLCTV